MSDVGSAANFKCGGNLFLISCNNVLKFVGVIVLGDRWCKESIFNSVLKFSR